MVQVYPACYSVQGARTIEVFGAYFPWAPWDEGYEVTNRAGITSGQKFIRNARELVGDRLNNSGECLFDMEPMSDVNWMEVDLRPVGSIPATVEEYERGILTSDVSAGLAWCPFKARVSWQEESGCIKHAIVDIGTGRLFSVPPTNKVSVELLTPKLARDADGNVVPAITRNARGNPAARNQFIASQVTCKVTCVPAPSDLRAEVSQAFHLCQQGEIPQSAQFVLPEGIQAARVRYSDPATNRPLTPDQLTASIAPEFERMDAGGRPLPNPWPILGFNTPEGFVSPDTGRLMAPSLSGIMRVSISPTATFPCVSVVVTAELDL